MSFIVIWDDPHVEVRGSIASRAEMEKLAEALARAEKNLPEDSPACGGQAKPEEKPNDE